MRQPRRSTTAAPWLAPTLLGLFVGLCLLVAPLRAGEGSAPQPAEVMQQWVAALRDFGTSQPMSDRLGPDARQQLEQDLARAEAALASGHWLGSLRPYASVADRLAQAIVRFETDPIRDLEGLEVEQQALRAQLERLGSPLRGKDQRPAALQALFERAYDTATGYLVSSGLQGREAGLGAGIYNLKVARSHANLARLLASLQAPAPELPVGDVPGLTAYLDRLEVELLERYQPPLTQERHATFIGLSATLKLGRELRDEDFQLGALEYALSVARSLAQFDGADTQGVPGRQVLRDRLAGWDETLASLDVDVTLPGLWLEDAREALDNDSVGNAEELADAHAILGRVLDDYFDSFERAAVASASTPQSVTVTLVRWPFT